MRAFSTVAVLVLVVAVSFFAASCSKQPTAKPEGAATTLAEPAGGGAGDVAELADEEVMEGEAEEEATVDPSAAGAQDIVDEVGAPIFEGATPGTVETEGDTRKAIYLTDAEYDAVRDFYLQELKEPDWTNNGFEAGPFGGDTWEFKSADETKLVTIDSESDAANTEITFTVRPAEE